VGTASLLRAVDYHSSSLTIETYWNRQLFQQPVLVYPFRVSQDVFQMDAMKLDPLTVTASDLAILLGDGRVSSVYLVEMYLDQIERHNKNGAKIGAIISTPDRAEVLATARHLDSERAEKGPRGPMHGIPIIVKVRNSPSKVHCEHVTDD
jgi:hypothetical protein